MPYVPPTYNLSATFWGAGHIPSTHAPDGIIAFQHYLQPRLTGMWEPAFDNVVEPPIQFRIEPATYLVLRANSHSVIAPNAIVKTILGWTDANGLTWYYRVKWWEWMHPGFPNAYIVMDVSQCGDGGLSVDHNR